MSDMKNLGFSTRQIYAGRQTNSYGPLVTPIYQSSTFMFDTVEQGGARFAGEENGYIYTRLYNPSLAVIENKLANLENGEAALATASGMGAITSAIYTIISAGDEIIADDTLYGCTFTYLTHGLTKLGVNVKLVDMSDVENVKKALTPKTKIVYFETPCNPNLKIIDIEEVAKAAHEYNSEIQVMVDNTFCSPYLTRPLDLGADIVVHSATKYINGHGDVIAGFIVGKLDFITLVHNTGFKDMTGAVMSPFDAFLIERGLKTLSIRMDRHCSNAAKLADFFVSHPAVKKVYYPGLKDFPGHDIAAKQMSQFGGMVSVELNASREETAAALNNLKLAKIAVSLGDPETLVEHAATMTHSTYTKEELAASGISESLIRISVGLEDVEDIMADFDQAFKTILG